MKKLKTWEMIKKLTENPEKKFRLVNGVHVVGVNPETSEIAWDDNVPLTICTAMLGDRWVEVKEPVHWQEALQAWLEGKVIFVEKDGKVEYAYWGGKDITLAADELRHGKWYIE